MGMKIKKKDVATGANARPASVRHAPWTPLWKLGLAALLAYGALQLLVRTDFFRTRVEAELSRRMGMEMRVGRIRATESFNLKLRDVISVSRDAGIEARTLRIRWRLFRPRAVSRLESLRVEGLALTFAPDPEGVVQPAVLGRMSRMVLESVGAGLPAPGIPGPAPGRGNPARAVSTGMDGPIEIRWASVRWQDSEGNLQASVSGMELAWKSMTLPNGRRVAHVDCRAAEVKVANGPQITGLHVELIDAGDRKFLLNLDATDWGTAQKPRPVETEYRELLDAME
jgi:hypothetical protein